MIKVSVIVPVYNSEKYLRECVDSIVNQTLKDIEILFVDDGSTDQSLTILEEYASRDNRIQVIKGTHRGGGAARNLGIEHAQGEYLSFFDSDDIMEAGLLQTLYEKSKLEQADVTVCSVRFWHELTGAVTEESCGLRVENLPEKEVFSYKDMTGRIFNTFHNWPWNKMFRRAFVEEHGLRFQELMRTNDMLFVNKALVLATRITTCKCFLIRYRIRLSGSCQSSNQEAPMDFYSAFKALKSFLIEQDIYEDVKQSFVNHALDGCIANLNTTEFLDGQKHLYEQLQSEILEELDILGHEDDYFYEYNFDNDNMDRLQTILSSDYERYLLSRGKEIKDLLQEQRRVVYDVEKNYQESATYRVGKAIMAPYRVVKKWIKG